MPMWTNRGSGVGAANGTTTHTVTIPFSPTSGRLLVAVMGGAVTFTTPTGWTAGPSQVGNQGLYVFTKTSDGTETSISTTHNGSNYPITWAFYEFASGSALTGTAGTATGVATGTTVWATVTALPGTAVTVFGAGTMGASSGVTSYSCAFTAPWIEDVDSFTAAGASPEGTYLAVGYQDGVTTTTSAVLGSVTGTGTTGVGERLAFAVNATSPGPSVNAGADATLVINTQFSRTATESSLTSVTARNWEIVSGPSGAVSSIGTAAALTWTPSVTGTYTLRYSATHSAGTSTDDVDVTVTNPRPTFVADRGSLANATAATTSAVALTSPTAITPGNYLIARVAVDNSGTNGAAPGCTVTDPRSNTWTVLGPALSDPGAAAAGTTAYLAYTEVGTAYQAADSITFNWGGISTTAKAIVIEEWTYIHDTTPVAVAAVTANAAASTAVSVAITPTAADQMVYTCLSTEGIAADTFTGDADTTNGTWTTLTTIASANATATNNQRVMGQYKVVNASGAQTWNATITNRDWAALAVVFAPPPGMTTYQGAATLSSTATLTVAAAQTSIAAVSLTSTATLSSAGIRTTDGAVGLGATATLSANGVRVVPGAVALTSTPALTTGAQLGAQVTVGLPVAASLAADGTGAPAGGSALVIIPVLSVAATATYFAAVSLPVSSSLSVTSFLELPAAVSLSAVGTLSANAIRTTGGAVTLLGTASLATDGIRIAVGAVSLSAVGVLTSDGLRTTSGAVSLTGVGVLSTDGVRSTSGAVSLIATATLVGSGSLPSDTPPTVTAGRARPVARGSTVLLDVIATPPASQTISGHAWTIQSGGGSLSGANTATPTYSPPGSGSGLAVIRDTVTASGGGSATGDVTVSYHANVVAAENALTGIARATWDLPTSPASAGLGGIATLQGFADGFTVDKTQTISFKIAQSDTAGWTANIYRLGYYAGLGARDYGPLNPSGGQVTTSQAQPTSLDVDSGTTLKSSDCSNWSTTLSWTPPSWVPSGIYVLKLNRTGGGGSSHVMFVIRDDARSADFMFMPADSTWNAYNAFRDMGSTNWLAGNSLYFGTAVDQYNADCAHFVSYNRPFMNRVAVHGGYGAVQYSTFFTAEYGMLRFMERNGVDTKYYGCIDSAGDSTGTLLKGNGSTIGGVRAGIFTGHNEYWSNGMRSGWEAFKTAGGSVFSCAANEVFWRLVGSNNDSSGRPRTWECWKSTIGGRGNTRPEWTGTWRDPNGAGKGGNNPENTFTGTIFVTNGPDLRALVVPFAGGYSAQPLWRNTAVATLTTGQSFTSGTEIVGFEWDTYGPAGTDSASAAAFLAAPHPRIRYCSTATYNTGAQLTDAGQAYGTGNNTHRLVVVPSGSNGGITFGTGTCNWALGVDNANTYQLMSDNTNVRFQQATLNMFYDMGATAATIMAGLTEPTPVDWFPSGATNLVATASLTAGASAVSVQGAATFTASASLTAGALRTTAGAVSLGATPSLTLGVAQTEIAATALNAGTTLAVSGIRTTAGSVTASAVGVLVAGVSLQTTSGVVSLTVLGSLSAGGGGVGNGAAVLSVGYTLVVNGVTWKIGAANLGSSVILGINGLVGVFGAAQLVSSVSLIVGGSVGSGGGFSIVALGELSIGLGVIARIGAATLLATSGLSLGLTKGTAGTLLLIASALLSFIELFPEVDFAEPRGNWTYSGISMDPRWSTVGIHAESVRAW